MKHEKIVEQYLSMITGAFSYPSHGIDSSDFESFIGEQIRNGHVDADDSDDALDDHPIALFLAYLLSKGWIPLEKFKKLVVDTNFQTGCHNFKEAYSEMLSIGIRINDR